jgi:hypothetical protein
MYRLRELPCVRQQHGEHLHRLPVVSIALHDRTHTAKGGVDAPGARLAKRLVQ